MCAFHPEIFSFFQEVCYLFSYFLKKVFCFSFLGNLASESIAVANFHPTVPACRWQTYREGRLSCAGACGADGGPHSRHSGHVDRCRGASVTGGPQQITAVFRAQPWDVGLN